VIRAISQLWGILLLLAGWQLWVWLGGYNAIVMPPPMAVFADLVTAPLEYLRPTLSTLLIAAFGLMGGMALGIGLALLAWSSRLLNGMLSPLALVFSAIPVVCLIPVLARLFGYDQKTVFAVVVVITFFPSFVFCAAGLRAVPPSSEDLFRVLGSSTGSRLLRLAIPSAVPSIMVALRITAAQSILAAMVAEFLMGTSGLGHLFAVTHADFKMERAIGASIVAIVLSTLIYLLTARAEAWARTRWAG
jgi:NitT/TauT family transport system permease protein